MNTTKMFCYTYSIINNKVDCDKSNFLDLMKVLFNTSNKNVKKFENGNQALIFDEDDENYLSLDLLKIVNGRDVPKDWLFFRIGRQKELEGALKRDKKTFMGEPILDAADQEKYELEICTYLLVDTKTGIILELYGQYAPSIKGFINILNSFLSKNENFNSISIKYNHILTEKMVESLKDDGTKLSKIGYTYNIPDVDKLQYLGLDIAQIKALKELDVLEVEVILKNKSRIPLTKNSDRIKYTINAFKECVKDIKDTLYFKGSTSSSKSKNYTFNKEEVTYMLDINSYKIDDKLKVLLTLDEFAEQVFEKMYNVYCANSKDILNYIS